MDSGSSGNRYPLCRRRPIFPGSFPPSIFGTGELNFRVRDGNGWDLTVMNTSSSFFFAKRKKEAKKKRLLFFHLFLSQRLLVCTAFIKLHTQYSLQFSFAQAPEGH